MSYTNRLEEAVRQAESASEIARQWANGPENTTVPTESGPLPTIAEFLRGKGSEIDQNAANIAAFESDLAANASTKLIAGVQARQLRLIDGIKGLIAQPNVTMHVRGFYAGSSSGGGEFYFDPLVSKAAHNGGSVIAPEALVAWDGTSTNITTLLNWTGSGSGCFVRITDHSAIYVSWFGAKGDGVSNDAPSIQAAVNYANSISSTTAEVRLGSGVFCVSTFITLLSNVHLIGVGDSTVIKGKFPSPINRILTSPSNVLQKNIAFRSLKVDRSEPNSQHGVLLGGIDGLLIDSVHVFGFGPGVMSGAMGISPFDNFAAIQSSNVTVQNCTITRCNNFGIAFGNVKNGRIINNNFIECWRECIGLEAWGDGTPAFNNTLGVVENCVASGNTIYIDTNAAYRVSGFPGPAIFVGASSSEGRCLNCSVTGNTVHITNTAGISGYAGIIVYGGTTQVTENCLVADNVIFGAPSNGIAAGIAGYLTRNVSICNNTIIGANTASNAGAAGSAIYVRSLTGSIISSNKVIGSTHTYGTSDDSSCNNNTFLDNDSRGHTLLSYLKGSTDVSTVFRDPLSYSSTAQGDIIQDAFTLADDESITLRERGGGCRCITFVTSNNGGNYAILIFNGGVAPIVIAKSVDVVTGATNPDTDNALNVYPVSGNRIGVKNRLGLSRTIQVTTFGVK